MFTFAWPWMFAFIPLPLLVWLLFPTDQAGRDAALRVPSLDDFGPRGGMLESSHVRYGPFLLAIFLWLLLVLAGARPQWLGDLGNTPVGSRDLTLAVDLSGSMRNRDFIIDNRPVNRLQAVKKVVGDFVKRRKGDRIGLIVFGTRAYQYVPVTFDTRTLSGMLNETFIGLAGHSTAIGDAIGLAIKRLDKQRKGEKVLILLTDGQNTDGTLDPIKAAQLARQVNLKIYTVGMGRGRSSRRLTRTPFFRFPFRSRGRTGDLDETVLRRIAEITGGKYFRANNTAELNQIYFHLDQLEPVEREEDRFRPRTDLFHWLLGLVAMVVLVYLLVLYWFRGKMT